MSNADHVMGIDIGGTGVKAAIVDVSTGELVTERLRVETPDPSTPEAVLDAVVDLQKQLKWKGDVGCGFPGAIKAGVVLAAPNLDSAWQGHDLAASLKEKLKTDVVAVGNDADVAGLAEVKFGAGKDVEGTVVLITVGTGLGSAVFYDGVLLPGTELGHIEIKGKDAETTASNSAREDHEWSFKKWGKKLARYLRRVQAALAVDLFIIGGGASKKWDKLGEHIKDVGCLVVPAALENNAGVVGAGLLVARERGRTAARSSQSAPAPSGKIKKGKPSR